MGAFKLIFCLWTLSNIQNLWQGRLWKHSSNEISEKCKQLQTNISSQLSVNEPSEVEILNVINESLTELQEFIIGDFKSKHCKIKPGKTIIEFQSEKTTLPNDLRLQL
jgi:hypothetical protein